jgi:fatty acid kinase
MNPSTADLLRAAQSVDAEEIVLLPNNSNIVLAAEHAAANADRVVEVVGTRSIQAGLAALLAFDGTRTAAENAAEMREAIEAVATGEVTVASRDVELDGVAISKGNWLGLADDKPVAADGDFEEVALAVVARLIEGRHLLTVLVGQGAPALDGLLGRIESAHPEAEIDVQQGGQPHYALLLSAE